MVSDSQKVVFWPKGNLSFRPIIQKDEKMSDKKFADKYWEMKIEPYNLYHEVDVSDHGSNEEDAKDSSYAGSKIDLEDTSGDEESGDEYQENSGAYKEEDLADEAEHLKSDMIDMDEESEDEAQARRCDKTLVAGSSKWDNYQ